MAKKSKSKGTLIPRLPPRPDDPGVMHTGTGPYGPTGTPEIWEHDATMEAYLKKAGIKPSKPLKIKPTKHKSGGYRGAIKSTR
jgi:hypothetical protein